MCKHNTFLSYDHCRGGTAPEGSRLINAQGVTSGSAGRSMRRSARAGSPDEVGDGDLVAKDAVDREISLKYLKQTYKRLLCGIAAVNPHDDKEAGTSAAHA